MHKHLVFVVPLSGRLNLEYKTHTEVHQSVPSGKEQNYEVFFTQMHIMAVIATHAE